MGSTLPKITHYRGRFESMSSASEGLTLCCSFCFLFLGKYSRTQNSTNPRQQLSNVFFILLILPRECGPYFIDCLKSTSFLTLGSCIISCVMQGSAVLWEDTKREAGSRANTSGRDARPQQSFSSNEPEPRVSAWAHSGLAKQARSKPWESEYENQLVYYRLLNKDPDA